MLPSYLSISIDRQAATGLHRGCARRVLPRRDGARVRVRVRELGLGVGVGLGLGLRLAGMVLPHRNSARHPALAHSGANLETLHRALTGRSSHSPPRTP